MGVGQVHETIAILRDEGLGNVLRGFDLLGELLEVNQNARSLVPPLHLPELASELRVDLGQRLEGLSVDTEVVEAVANHHPRKLEVLRQPEQN